MRRLLLVAACAALLTGCGNGMSNEEIVEQTNYCLKNNLDPVLDKSMFDQYRVVCTPPELTMYQKLEFMTWVAREDKRIKSQKESFESKQKVTQ